MNLVLCGGRGGMSGATGSDRHLQFSGGSTGKSQELYPSQVNRLNSTGDVERLTDHFADMHGKKDTEFAITIDKNGYATSYTHGQSGSVVPNAKYAEDGALVVHNHPKNGWANFSGADLDYVAQTGARGIVATSRKVSAPPNSNASTVEAYKNRRAGEYRFDKGSHFKKDEFRKAIRKIVIKDNNYDRDLHKWLDANQKKYGYKYTFKPTNKAGE